MPATSSYRAEGNPDQRISTGDAVQAATGLLVHAALGLPLLPLAPKSMAVLVQVCAAAAYCLPTAAPAAATPCGKAGPPDATARRPTAARPPAHPLDHQCSCPPQMATLAMPAAC